MIRVLDRWRPKTAAEAFAQFAPFVFALAFSFWWRHREGEELWFANLDKIPLSLATTTAVLAGFSTIPLGVLVTSSRRDPFPGALVAVRFLSRSATTALAASAYSVAMVPGEPFGMFADHVDSIAGLPVVDVGKSTVYCQIWVLLLAWAFLNFFRAVWTLRWLSESAG